MDSPTIKIVDIDSKQPSRLHYIYVVVFPFRNKPFQSDWHLRLNGALESARLNKEVDEYYEIRKHYMTPIDPRPPYSLSKRWTVMYQEGITIVPYGHDYSIYDL